MATVLIVDDLAANREVLVTLLRHEGHRVLEAADGAEALAEVQAVYPDLIISDVLMPVMDGYEFVRQLRLDPDTCRIPVVFYTANYGQREARTLALSSGVFEVLTKPVEPREVLEVVARVLAGETGPTAPEAAPGEAFDRDHLRLLTDKVYESDTELRSANARLRALIAIGLELASERDGDQLLLKVCTASRELFGATYVTLGLIDRAAPRVQRLFACGVEAGEWLRPGDEVPGILNTVVTERCTLRGEAADGDAARLGLPGRHPPVGAYLATPIASPSHVYGWLSLVCNEGRSFTESDGHLVMALAGQVGRIYENGYFYSVAQKRADELEREVLERQQAELAVRAERDRAQQYLDTPEVILVALDLEGRITLANRYACSVLGWTAEELLGRDWAEACLPDRVRENLWHEPGAPGEGDISIIEKPVRTRSGEERLIEWRNTLLRDPAGQVVGTLRSGTDITERSQAIQAMRTAEERMRFALENADVGIWDMDYVTGVLQWSPIMEAQYGHAPGTFPGTIEAFVACVHPDDRESLAATISGAMKAGTDFSTQHRAVWPDGTVRWLTGAGRVLLGEHGEPVRGVGISLDVTERRTLEQQYQQAQKMEAIGRLAGGVAHDFNNLLTAILGYCELLLGETEPDDPHHADMVEIQKAGESAAGLTRQLLAFSRKEIIEPRLIDLNAVLSGLRAMLGRLIGEDVKVVMVLDPRLGPVRADHGQVEQIVMNLAVNARDAMPKGGTLTIETANIVLDEHYARTHIAVTPGRHVVLAVSDTGTGMTPEVQARLFEPFFTTKEPGKGTGLGLATVHGIVAQSGGSVNVYSEVGRGSTIKVYFPHAAAEAMPEAPVPAPRPRSTGQTVLLVEDAAQLRELTRRLLEREGYTVLVAANAAEAHELFARNPSIDVVLTDVVMPGASGPELTTRLVEQRPALKVIYMSGYTEEAIVQHGVLNPGIAFLHKPFTSETLAHKIREALDG